MVRRQILYLKKYRLFSQDPGKYDSKQGELREQCLRYYELPSGRGEPKRFQPAALAFRNMVSTEVRTVIFISKLLSPSIAKFLQEMDLASWHGLTPAFIMEVLRQKSAKHLASREFRATLLPECSEPALLISNSVSFLPY